MEKFRCWTVLLVVFVIAGALALTEEKEEVVQNDGRERRWINQKDFLRLINARKIKCMKTKPPRNEPQRNEPPRNKPPKVEPPKVESSKVEPPRNEPPRNEPPRNESPRNEPPRNEPPKVEPPRNEPPRNEPPRNEPPRNEPPRNKSSRNEPPRNEPPRNEPPRNEPPRNEPPRNEPPITSAPTPASEATTKPRGPEPAPENRIKCANKSTKPTTSLAGDKNQYTVHYNLVPMSKNITCWETVTYAISGDYTLLKKLQPLLERWKAPVSIALYAANENFRHTLRSIAYLRNCTAYVSELVTFHVYYDDNSVIDSIPSTEKILSMRYNCEEGRPWEIGGTESLGYPVNVGRNIAKAGALTYFHIVADIDFYPSSNLASNFMEMVTQHYRSDFEAGKRRIFALPIFELINNSIVPSNKTELETMLEDGEVDWFYDEACKWCDVIPNFDEWYWKKQFNFSNKASVVNRTGDGAVWEPIYIGTDEVPKYDETITSDKLPTGREIHTFLLCGLKYEFTVLDNAFLVVLPGIQKRSGPKLISNEVIQHAHDVAKKYNITDNDTKKCTI